MTSHVFTYGSLMFAPVWRRVVHGAYASLPAVADGYVRQAIRGETYPGMVPLDAGSVEGVLYLDVDQDDIAALDAFEGEEYRRVPLAVTLASGETMQAETYLYLRPENLSGLPWQPDSFELERFVRTYCGDTPAS